MKKCKKLLAFTLSVLLAFACYVVPAFALSSASQYGLEATLVTDKESYKANEEIHVTVTVKNTNDFKVEAVSIESLLPETLTLKDGSNSTKTVDLEPGETLTLSFTAVKEKEETSATEPESQSTEPTETEPVLPSESETVKPSESESVKPTIGTINTAIDDSTTVFPKEVTEMNSATIIHSNNPNTGDISSIKTVVIAIIAVLALIAIILILLHKHQKQTTKIISLVMCIAVATTAITGVSFFTAKGTDDGRKSFTVEKVITVDGEETNVSAEVKYQEPKQTETELGLVIDQKDFTTVEREQQLTGKINNTNSISDITYSITYDCDDIGNVKSTEAGTETIVIKNNSWSLSGIKLFPGNNLITFTAHTTDGKSQSKEISIFFDRGSQYNLDESHIQKSDGISYVDNIILVFFKKDVSEKRIEEICQSINGTIVGRINSVHQYQIKIPQTTLEGLKEITQRLNKLEEVKFANYDTVTSISENSLSQQKVEPVIPNDPWKDNIQGITGVDWDEDNPNGYNWWLESIQAPSAWAYNNRFSKVKVGIVDTGFDSTHEDLNLHIVNASENSVDNHGTLCAGIIGAIPNNNKGITGIVWNSELFGIDVQKKEEKFISENSVYNGITQLLEMGVDVINMSIGYEGKEEIEVDNTGKIASAWIAIWRESIDNDFIIVQSAGNKGRDAIKNAWFCSVTQQNAQMMIEEYKEKLERPIDVSNILNSIIIVGAVEKNGDEYKLCSFSNYGSQISVSAPGKKIFSTQVMGGIDGSYGAVDGTSVAAPIVAGVASLVWSIDPTFSAEEVKNIVCNCTKDTAKTNKFPSVEQRTYKIVNAKLAVEEAIRKTDSDAKFVGGDGSVNNPYQIANDAQLNAVRNYPESNFVLVNDIDLSKYENWVPIPKFSGSLDGKGHTIKNLKIDYVIENKENKLPESYGVGLFDGIKDSSKIKNINLEAIDINIKNNVKNLLFDFSVGGITSTCENSLIDNCTVSGKIKINDENTYVNYFVAGISGIATDSSIINNCTNQVDINVSTSREGYEDMMDDTTSAGGICAYIYDSSISNCINNGNIYAIANCRYLECGGIVGSNFNPKESVHLIPIRNCKNYGDVKALGGYSVTVGGIIGRGHMSIDSNINYGDISSYAYGWATSGGVTGNMYSSPHLQASIKRCVNYGDITSELLTSPEILSSSCSISGGIVGSLPDMDSSIFIEQCYNAGSKIVANSKDSSRENNFYLNRICGDCFISSRGAPILNCYSLDTTTLNGSIPTEDIGPDQKNGGSMTKAEIEKAIQELGFELPGELRNAS